MKKIFTALLLAASGGAVYSAQPSEAEIHAATMLNGAIYVLPHRESADGVLGACGLDFLTITKDFSTKQGGMVKMVGSYYLRKGRNDAVGYSLKLGVLDGQDPEATAPANAFVGSVKGLIPKKGVRALAENPGFALFVGRVDSDVVAVLKSITEDKKMTVGFNRRPGGQDVTSIVNLTVVDTKIEGGNVSRTYSDQMLKEFMQCGNDLLRDVTAK